MRSVKLNRAEQFIKAHLSRRERELLSQLSDWIDTAFQHVTLHTTVEAVHHWIPWHAGTVSSILFRHMREVLDDGQAHGTAECHNKQKKFGIRLADDLPAIDVNDDFTPTQAIDVLKKRSIKLAGDFELTLITKVKQILIDHLAGESVPKTMERLAELKDITLNRAALITITETCYAYNRGRLISYRENNVDYVRFSAIMDSRTSLICQSRNGLVMRMDDPELAANTPPLHGRCRSVLTPVYSRYEPELITTANTDWKHVAPIPKSWKVA